MTQEFEPPETHETRRIPLAVIGMACRAPGARDLEQFWDLLIEGREALGELPRERFDRDLYHDPRPGVRGKSYATLGGVIPDRPPRAGGWRLPAALAANADATHRRMCEVAAEALGHAGMDPLQLAERHVGVYVGHTLGTDLDGDRQLALGVEQSLTLLDEVASFGGLPPADRKAIAAEVVRRVRVDQTKMERGEADLASHMAAGAVSAAFGLTGPFLTTNAACASSLEALLQAARAVQGGAIGMAIVGGSSVCSRNWLVLFSQARALSASGSRPFDQAASGLVVGEACVALVLKTLARALADGDPIQAVLRGVGVASDGRGRSLWAPRSEGQVAAIHRAYFPGFELADIQYIEAHATATQLGDATEIASLSRALRGVLPPGKKLPMASLKGNVGHTLEAAGLLGMIKAILCLQKGLIPKAIRIERLNAKVDWPAAPVYVPTETMAWPAPAAGKPRRAAVSAFGIGGLNVHVALEAAPSPGAAISPDAVAMDAAAIDAAPLAAPRRNGVPGEEPIAVVGLGWISSASTRDFVYDWRRHRIPPKEVALADPLQFMTLAAADEALLDAGHADKTFDREKTGVIVGAEFSGAFDCRLQQTLRLPYLERLLAKALVSRGWTAAAADARAAEFRDAWHARWPVLEDNSGSYSTISLATRIAKTWDLMGGACAVDCGDASAMAALGAAMDRLRAGDANLMLCGAAGPSGAAGLGAGVLLLKRLRDARRDGDSIHAVLDSLGAAHGDPAQSLAQCLERCLARATTRLAGAAIAVRDAAWSATAEPRLAVAVRESLAKHRGEHAPALPSLAELGDPLPGAAGMLAIVATIRSLSAAGGNACPRLGHRQTLNTQLPRRRC